MNKEFYLDDYSAEDILKNINNIELLDILDDDNIDNIENEDDEIEEEPSKDKPSFTMKPNYNSKGEKVVVFSINIPLKKNGLKIDILINNEMYKNIGKHFKKEL